MYATYMDVLWITFGMCFSPLHGIAMIEFAPCLPSHFVSFVHSAYLDFPQANFFWFRDFYRILIHSAEF